MEIRKHMKAAVVSLPATATIADAARLVVERGVGTLPVVDAAGHLVGVVGHAHLLKLVMPTFVDMIADIDYVHDFGAAEEGKPDETTLRRPITELMVEPIAVHADAGLVRAYALMHKFDLYDLPVVDSDNRLVGLASRVDVARACLASWEKPASAEPEYD